MRDPNPRLPNIVVRKPEAEKLLERDLTGRRTDYYVLSDPKPRRVPKNLGGPYSSRAKADERLRQVEFFKRAKPGPRSNTTAPELDPNLLGQLSEGHRSSIFAYLGAPTTRGWDRIYPMVLTSGPRSTLLQWVRFIDPSFPAHRPSFGEWDTVPDPDILARAIEAAADTRRRRVNRAPRSLLDQDNRDEMVQALSGRSFSPTCRFFGQRPTNPEVTALRNRLMPPRWRPW